MTIKPLYLVFLFISLTNAVYLATNFGFCATFIMAKVGIPVTFFRCNPLDTKQSSWKIIPAGAGQPANALLFCVNNADNLCAGVNIATGIIHLVNKDLADPAQQFTPLTPTKISRFTNIASGNNYCANVIASFFVMMKCKIRAPFQQLFIYGPDS